MKLKTILCLCAATLATAAYAQSDAARSDSAGPESHAAAVHARGQALNRAGQPSAFHIHAVSARNQIRGHARFRTRLENGTILDIRMTDANKLQSRGNRANLNGTAVMTIIQGDQRRTVTGVVQFSLADLVQRDNDRMPEQVTDALPELPSLEFDRALQSEGQDRDRKRDRISVTFRSPQLDRVFEYNGAVVNGHVFVRNGRR